MGEEEDKSSLRGPAGPYPLEELRKASDSMRKEIMRSKSSVVQRLREVSGLSTAAERKDPDRTTTEKNTNAGDKKGENSVLPAAGGDLTLYRCDFCDFLTQRCSEVKEHLVDRQHFSASLCSGEALERGGLRALILLQAVTVSHPGHLFRSLLAVCPACNEVFLTPYSCSAHYHIYHDRSATDVYAVTEVTHSMVVADLDKLTCRTCGDTLRGHDELHRHWLDNSHFPYPMPLDGDLLFFRCSLCGIIFYNFFACKQHVRDHEGEEGKSVGVCYFKKATTSRHLLVAKNTFALQISNLRQLEHDMRLYDRKEPTVEMVGKTIAELKRKALQSKNCPL